MTVPVTGYSHVRITVTDIGRSRAFYDSVFGFDVAFALSDDPSDEERGQLAFLFGGVIYQIPGGLFGIRPVADPGDRFEEDHTGLDHLSFGVPARSDLDAAATRLDSLGIGHDGVKDIGVGFILEFRDPDNIALELFAPAE